MIRNFHVGIKALIVKDNKALVLREEDVNASGKFLYDLPGGRIEDEESIEQALRRELKEELGISKVSIGDIIHAEKAPFYNKNGTLLIRIYYHVYTNGKENLIISQEHKSLEWVSRADLSKKDKSDTIIPKAVKTVLEKVLK